MLNILIVSDHKMYREALSRLLSVQPIFNVMGICADTHAAMNIAARENPDIVLIDASSDPLAAIEATKRIVIHSNANVIAITGNTDPTFSQHMLAAGALGYLTKQSLSAEIINAIKEVAKDNLYLCGQLPSGLPGDLNPGLVQTPVPPRIKPSSHSHHPTKKPSTSLASNTRKKITETATSNWHRILQFTN
ncbi:MAG: response regulator transcription factor [Chitinophagaceae bacterium]